MSINLDVNHAYMDQPLPPTNISAEIEAEIEGPWQKIEVIKVVALAALTVVAATLVAFSIASIAIGFILPTLSLAIKLISLVFFNTLMTTSASLLGMVIRHNLQPNAQNTILHQHRARLEAIDTQLAASAEQVAAASTASRTSAELLNQYRARLEAIDTQLVISAEQ